MSVSVEEIVGGPANVDGAITTCQRMFNVMLDTNPASGDDLRALYASGLPAKGDLHPVQVTGVSRPRAIKKTAENIDGNRSLWRVTVEYSNDPARIEKTIAINDINTAPWERLPRYSYDVADYQVAMEYDAEGTPVVNTVGDKFDPPIPKSRKLQRIIINRASEDYNAATAAGLTDTINDREISIDNKGFGIGTVRLVKWSGEKTVWADETGDESTYYEETIELEVANGDLKSDGETLLNFDLEVANTGYRYLVGGTPTRVPDVTTPVYLNEAGDDYQSGEITTPYYLTFKPFPVGDWEPLGLE
jgi:hypothetical protein